MGTVSESKLVSAFKFFDLNGDGAISRDELAEICKQIDPDNLSDENVNTMMKSLDKRDVGYIDYSAFAVWVTSGMLDGGRIMTIYEDAVAKLPGVRLANGDQTDAGLDKIRSFLTNALDLSPAQYATPKATTKLTWLRDIADLLDPLQNPGGFRICQNAVVERGALGALLGLAQQAQSDAVVIKALEVLARTIFGNMGAAAELAQTEDFLTTLRVVLANGQTPEKLTMLQLAQAVAASSMSPEVQKILPQLLAEVVPLLADPCFAVLQHATFDVLVSTSFGSPAAIVEAVSWTEIASWLAESAGTGRPAWLDQEILMMLASGLLATNVLSLPASTGNEELQARQAMCHRLGASDFMEFFVLAMEAAVTQREWPVNSGVFHSVSRLAPIAVTLAGLGFRRQLVGIVAPLAEAVQTSPEERTTRLALIALRSLVEELACLEKFLTLSEFRSETLEVLHQAGDEKEATDLISCTTSAENVLAAAQATFDYAQSELTTAPSIRWLAEIFNKYSPMDGELTMEQLLQILPEVPVGPIRDVKASLSGDQTCKFGFLSFTQRIYGTPTVLGWWPSLMEDVARMWSEPDFQQLQPPPLPHLLSYFEAAAHGASGLPSSSILHEVLPTMGQPVDGEAVEELFAEIRGDEPLNFKDFGTWMHRYFRAVNKEQKEIRGI